MINTYIIWDVNPEIFRIGPLAVRWYGLAFALTFYIGYLIMRKIFRNEGLSDELLDKLTVYCALGTILGARFGHVFFYDFEYYIENPLKMLKIWEGGLASHGAAIGLILSSYLFGRKYQKSFLWTLDRVVIIVALSGIMIRLGNLANSEIYGHPTNMPWGFKFVRDYADGTPTDLIPASHPTQIYEALVYGLLFFYLLWDYFKRYPKIKEGSYFGIFLIYVFTARFFIEFLKNEQVAFEKGMLLNMGQLLSIPFVILGVGILVYSFKKKVVENE